ncbi:MAG: hypothetical protein ACOH2H_22695 [Cypionkella sp.]
MDAGCSVDKDATLIGAVDAGRVLCGGSGLTDETRDRVVAAVDLTGFVRNRLAAAFISVQAIALVAIYVPRLTQGLFGHVLGGVYQALTRLGYQVMIGRHNHAPENEEAWLRQVVSWHPAKVILSGRNQSEKMICVFMA